LFFAW